MRLTEYTSLFKSLSTESRLELFLKLNNCSCAEGTQACMTDLARELDTSLPNVQRNVRELERAGLVEVTKVARTCYCKTTKLGNDVLYFLTKLDDR